MHARLTLVFVALCIGLAAVVAGAAADTLSTGAAADPLSSTGAPDHVAVPRPTSFPDLCAGDETSDIDSARWEAMDSSALGAGSLLTFNVCNSTPVRFARLILTNRWTGAIVVNAAIPATADASSGCTQYSAWTNLPVIAGGNIVSELRAVAGSQDDMINFTARRCIV